MEPVTVTICGTPNRETLAALIDLALTAGLSLALQPRTIATPAAPLQLPPAPVSRVVKVVAKAKRKARKVVPPPVAIRLQKAAAQIEQRKPTPAAGGRTYAVKSCVTCGKSFTPTGPNGKVCATCKAEFTADVSRAELETVWNGSVRPAASGGR